MQSIWLRCILYHIHLFIIEWTIFLFMIMLITVHADFGACDVSIFDAIQFQMPHSSTSFTTIAIPLSVTYPSTFEADGIVINMSLFLTVQTTKKIKKKTVKFFFILTIYVLHAHICYMMGLYILVIHQSFLKMIHPSFGLPRMFAVFVFCEIQRILYLASWLERMTFRLMNCSSQRRLESLRIHILIVSLCISNIYPYFYQKKCRIKLFIFSLPNENLVFI